MADKYYDNIWFGVVFEFKSHRQKKRKNHIFKVLKSLTPINSSLEIGCGPGHISKSFTSMFSNTRVFALDCPDRARIF